MLMSDKLFLKIDSLYANAQSLDNQIGERLDFIESTRPGLIHDGKKVETESFMNYDDHTLMFSLKKLRQIKSSEIIYNLWKNNKFDLRLFSVEQKKTIVRPDTYVDIIRGDSRKNLQRYLPEFGGKLLNENVSLLSIYECFSLPLGIIPLLNRGSSSAENFACTISANIKQLDQLEMSDDKFKKLLTEIVQVTIPVKVEASKIMVAGSAHDCIPLLHPSKLEELPDSVFAKFEFEHFSARELLSILYPYEPESLNILGNTVVKKDNGVYFGEQSIYEASFGTISDSHFEQDANKHEEYNIHRLGLLTKEQYLTIRDRAHPEIVKLGDKIHQYPL